MTPAEIMEHEILKLNYSFDIASEYDAVLEFIKYLIGADCSAITVTECGGNFNHEVLYSEYKHYDDSTQMAHSYKEDILNSIIRDRLTDNPREIFHRSFIRKLSINVDIYMFGLDAWKIRIYYDADTHSFTISGFKSA
jgi:hypothetical protein